MFCLHLSCKEQSSREKIDSTIHAALKAINEKDYLKMQQLIGVDAPSDTSMEDIVGKVNRVDYLIDKYHGGRIENLEIQFANGFDYLSRKKITIPLFEGYDSTTGIQQAVLVLYVGPPIPVPLTKLSGFEYEGKYDTKWREFLIREGKLPDMDSPSR